MNLFNDIYYKKTFNELYIGNDEELFQFNYQNNEYYFFNTSVKRKINNVGEVNIPKWNLYDLETPYGYGGFLSNTNNKEFLNEAFHNYKIKCNKENIVAEFIRIHPFNNTPHHISSKFNFYTPDRKVVVVELTLDKDKRWETYNSKTRNILRKCEKNGLTVSISDNQDWFKRIYKQTMIRNNAGAFYFFNDSYFDKLFKMDNVLLFEAKLNSEVIAMSFMIFGNDISHYHLSANTNLGMKYNANYYLLEKMFQYARQLGIKFFLLGGGDQKMKMTAFSDLKRNFLIYYMIFT
ncbi:MAG: GNAT family N-acetyltransferase [Bacteroidales bacterium]|jgi:hypothetical protein|nr:GNAT family N-acetyltransferase [Bacteroidales bacterium]